jgi:hypothetical protein
MPLGRRQRIIAGLGVAIGFGAPFLLSVALVASSGDLSLLMFPLPFLGVLWIAHGLSFTSVTLEPDGVRLDRRWLSRLVPYAGVTEVDREPRRIGGLGAIGINGLFGASGWRFRPRTGWHYLAIASTRDLVWLHTTAGLVAISPGEPDRFVEELRARLRRQRGPAPSGSPMPRLGE